jgi:branched-chain amino acid transport system substrate-binding protein
MMKATRMAAIALAMTCTACLASDDGVSDKEIRLGASVVLSGPLGTQAREYGQGARLVFDAVNRKRGINGRKVTFITMDDGYDVARAVANTRTLIKDNKVFMIFNNTGTAHTMAILPLLEETQTVDFGPLSGAPQLREHTNRFIFHVRASYADEAARIALQLKQTGTTRIAAVYQDNPFGQSLITEVRKAMAEQGLHLASEVKMNGKQPDFKAAAVQAAQALPQAVVIAAAGTAFPLFIKSLQDTSQRPTYYGFSFAPLDNINLELGRDARGIILAQVVPSLKNVAIPTVAEYLSLLKQSDAAAKPSVSQFEGFIAAKLAVEALRRPGRNLTTATFIQALETGGDLKLGNFVAKYSPQSHSGPSYVELAIVDSSGQLRY